MGLSIKELEAIINGTNDKPPKGKTFMYQDLKTSKFGNSRSKLRDFGDERISKGLIEGYSITPVDKSWSSMFQ